MKFTLVRKTGLILFVLVSGAFFNLLLFTTLFYEERFGGRFAFFAALLVLQAVLSFLGFLGARRDWERSGERLQRVADAVPGVVYQYMLKPDRTQRFLMMSKGAQALFGHRREDLMRDFNLAWNMVPPSDVDELWRSIEQSATALTPWDHEFRIVDPSGRVKWIKGLSVPDPPESDGSMVWNGVFIDATEQKKMRAQLLQSQKMETVGTLAGGIAHDLNNQLTPVGAYIDLVLQSGDLNTSSRGLLEEADRSARRCSAVVQSLLRFSRPSASEKVPSNVGELVRSWAGLLRPLFPANISIVVHCEENLPAILANEAEIQTVLMNFAINARDAMAADGGALSIRVRPEEGHVKISVSDTGCGMTPEVMQRIFEPFFTTKPKDKGTGLGLAMVFKIVQDHGGRVTVSSEPGRGTTFDVFLPAASTPKESRMEDEKKKTEFPPELMGRGETVLFAEDEPALRTLAKAMLEKLGYRVVFARDSDETIENYRRLAGEIGCVVLDMTMPSIPGRQILKKILETDPKAKVILTSGFTSEGSTDDLIADGASDFLQKPYTLRPLAEVLRKTLSKPA